MKRKLNKRSLILLVSLVALLTITVGGTLAYIAIKTDSLINVFNPSAIQVSLSGPDADDTYTIANTGNVDVYVRVAVVAKQGGSVTLSRMELPTTTTANWILGNDGFLYYKQKVPAGSSVTLDLVVDTATTKVMLSAIQATPDAVSDWSTAVKVENGILIPKTN